MGLGFHPDLLDQVTYFTVHEQPGHQGETTVKFLQLMIDPLTKLLKFI